MSVRCAGIGSKFNACGLTENARVVAMRTSA
jgi:hypothetical protein